MFSRTPGHYPLDASTTPPLNYNSCVPRHCRVSATVEEEHNLPLLRPASREPPWISEVRKQKTISQPLLKLGFRTGNRFWQSGELVLDLKGYPEGEIIFLCHWLFSSGRKKQNISAVIVHVHSLGVERKWYICVEEWVEWSVGCRVPDPILQFYECQEAILVITQCWQLPNSWVAVVKVSSWTQQIRQCLQSGYSCNVTGIGLQGQLRMNSWTLLQLFMHLLHSTNLLLNKISGFSFLQ